MALPIQIDKHSGIPLYLQLGEQIRLHVHRGTLRPGDPMPTVRGLAVDLGINANTVARVYRELQAAGLLRLERGVGTFVARSRHAPPSADRFHEIEQKVKSLVDLACESAMSATELAQLIENLWPKEHDHVSR